MINNASRESCQLYAKVRFTVYEWLSDFFMLKQQFI